MNVLIIDLYHIINLVCKGSNYRQKNTLFAQIIMIIYEFFWYDFL